MDFIEAEIVKKDHEYSTCGLSTHYKTTRHAKCECGGYAHIFVQVKDSLYWHCLKCGRDFKTRREAPHLYNLEEEK